MILKNYKLDKHGSLHQIKTTPYTYDSAYNNIYNTEKYLRNSLILSALRVAFIKICIEDANEILDVGYGNGDFLRVAMMAFDKAVGYDISDYSPEGIHRVNNIYGKHDVVCFWDSLEHMSELSFIKNLNTKYIAVSMPYCHYEIMGEKWLADWKHLKPNEHLHHFTPDSLCKQMNEFGYEPVVINNDIEDVVRKSEDSLQNIFCAIYMKQ